MRDTSGATRAGPIDEANAECEREQQNAPRGISKLACVWSVQKLYGKAVTNFD